MMPLGSAMILAMSCMTASAQEPLPVSEGFNSFTGAGFSPTPSAGQLDSDSWVVLGLSDGAGTFGGTHTTGDFARGTSTGGVTTGGIYAFNTGGGNKIFGVQPSTDFTPGSFTLKIQNTTGSTVTGLIISYKIWYFNDQARANSLNFSHSPDNTTYTSVPALDFTTPAAADASPAWQSVMRSVTLTGLSILNSGFYFLRWTGNDVSGSGSRDEYGIDDISVQATSPEIDVQGGSPLVSIANGDVTPSTVDGTDFGAANIVTGMVDHTFTIENTGTADLNLTGGPPRVTVTGTDFSLITDASTPIASGGGTTTFTVRFDPSATGLRSGSISIANNDADENPYTFSIQGTGTATIDQVITNVLSDIATLLADPAVSEKAKDRLRDAQKALNKAKAKFASAKKQKDIKNAFANLQEGIEQLMKSGANVAGLIDDLVNAAKQFAQDAIDEAKKFAGEEEVDDEIEEAEEDFAHALQHVAKGEFDNAVKRFRKAWEHAQMALKAAGQPVLPKESEVEESDVEESEVVTDYVLEQNYPNPFSQIPRFAGNPSTKLSFALPEAGAVKLQIYDLLGTEVKTLVNEHRNAGRYEIIWNGRNRAGELVAGGIYLYRLTIERNGAAPVVMTRKLTVLK